jgi:type I restriction enzyme S subunit
MVRLVTIAAPKGLQTGPFGSQLKAEEYVEFGVPVVMPKDIYAGKIVTDGIARVPESIAKKLTKHRIATGDILFPRRGDLGRIGVVTQDNEGWLCGTGCLRARLKEDVDTNYIHQYVQLESVKRWLNSNALGQTMLNLNTEIIGNLPICIVPKREQTAIAFLLSTWNLAIEKDERLIAAKERQKKSLMQSLLTGNQRIKGFQKPWSEFHLGDLFKERSERASGHLPLVSITRESGIIPRNEDRKDTSSEDKSKYLRICPGDIGYNTMRMWQGVSALSSLEGIVSPAYTICSPKKGVDGEFMAYLFKLPRTINLFYRFSQGLTSDTWNLKYHHFRQIKVAIPEIEEQQAIARILKVCDEEILLLNKELAAIQKQKRGLMQRLLTGEWRVRVG